MNDQNSSDVMNGHPLCVERCRRNMTQAQLADAIKIGITTIWRAENDYPISATSRQRICAYLNMTSLELGLMTKKSKKGTALVSQEAGTLSTAPQEFPFIITEQNQLLERVVEHTASSPSEQHIGTWLALESCNIASLFDAGWTLDAILDSLRVVLQGVEGMPMMTRRKLLQLGGMAAISGIVPLVDRQATEEEQIQFTQRIGNSISYGWKLFNTTNTPQVLAVGQALLTLIQQNCFYLLPHTRPLLYSSAYRLIGAALHFHGSYEKAYQFHERAYITALEGADTWNMVQCRMWQANGFMEQKRYAEALQTNEAALRLINHHDNSEVVRTKAKLLASSAESAAYLGETKQVQEKLNTSKSVLEQFPQTLHDEFDDKSWHHHAGTCALILGHHDTAIKELQQAVQGLPAHLVVRNVTALMPLAIAYARAGEREKCLETTMKVIQQSKELNAQGISKQFSDYIREEIHKAFPHDAQITSLAM